MDGKGQDPKGVKVTDEELTGVDLKPHDFHGEWNTRSAVADLRRLERSL